MVDFASAYQAGLRAHQDANRAKAEINEVLREFSRQVSAASGGALAEIRMELRATVREHIDADLGVAAVRGVGARLAPSTAPRYQALVAFAPSQQNGETGEVELCEIRLATNGYPVTLRYADRDVRIHDRESLEVALVELLAHPSTGAKIFRLLTPVAAPS